MIFNGQYSSFFFVGVAGAGMSAIAQYLAGKGYEISGSDRTFALNPNVESSSVIQNQLQACGIQCFLNDGSGITKNVSAIVVSTAIEESNPDLVRAKELQIPVFHRSEVLAEIAASVKTIAVSGTSGKSTVTAMIFHILEKAGLNPSLITGAGLVSLERLGKIGNACAGSGEWLVIEADESDGSLVRYCPEIGLILNIDKDHKDLSELEKIFSIFKENIQSAQKLLFANGDHPLASKFVENRRFLFGTDNSFGVQGTDFVQNGFSIRFRVRYAGELVRFNLPLPGKHNMENALAAVACATAVGVPLRVCADALETFEGIHRRHQVLGTYGGVTLVDDFAHNPAKIAASIESVLACTPGRVLAWFQPHGFGPTRFLRKEIVEAIHQILRPQDKMFFSEIYYAGGTVVRDISAEDLVSDLKSLGTDASYIASRELCADAMICEAKSGDTILLMGARDPKLSEFANSVKQKLQIAKK